MISYIKGRVLKVGEHTISVVPGSEPSGGIAWEIVVPRIHQFPQNSEAELEIVMHWNAEQGPALYGFSTSLEKQLFILLISCSGIGPRLALGILQAMKPEELIRALSSRDTQAMSRVPGIGARKAEQLIVAIEPKITQLLKSGIPLPGNSPATQWHEIAEALQSLNYSRHEISRAMQHLNTTCASQGLAFDVLLRHALSFLAKRL